VDHPEVSLRLPQLHRTAQASAAQSDPNTTDSVSFDSGLWLIFPAWIIYQLSYELVDSLAGPVPTSKKTMVDRDARSNAAELLKHVTTKQE
jgi:hypothetical protein